MDNTYSSWEYSQGPILYIDSSGFRSIDDAKNFTYFYVVTYSPVEYKRKVTNELGVSTYEYKYSFGTDFSSRKTLGEYTFTGKEQMTKTVSHQVTEEGFSDSITKTFYIDTNINTNIQNNAQVVIDPTYKVDTNSWTLNKGSGVTAPNIGQNYIGWFSTTKTGYKTVTYSVRKPVYKQVRVDYGTKPCPGYGCWFADTFDIPHSHITWERYENVFSHYEYTTETRKEPYTYTEICNSYLKLNLNNVRDKIKDYTDFSSVTIKFKTKDYMNAAPNVYINKDVSTTSTRIKLQPKNASGTSAGGYIEYYLPMNYIMDTYLNNSEIFIIIEKGSCSAANGYLTEAFAFIEIEAASVPYVNLVVEAYSNSSKSWNVCCTVPYLNYKEIETLRQNKNQVSKNLFLPSNLPPTDANYRVRLDTNLVAKDAEMLTNFRLDVLTNQVIPSGSIDDKKVYVNNDSIERDNEIEIGDVDHLKLNILGTDYYQAKTYAGFLKKGANDISAYIKDSVAVIDENVDSKTPLENREVNTWYGYLTDANGGWVSNNLFIANTFNFSQVGILQNNDPNLINNILTFKVKYKNLMPYSSYTLVFKANVKKSFHIANVQTIATADRSKITTSRIYSTSSYNSSKVNVTNCNYTFYSPQYKYMNGAIPEYVSEIDACDKDIRMEIKIDTKNITNNDNEEMTIIIRSHALKNVTIKNLQCVCVDSNKNNYLDITMPYNTGVDSGRKSETHMVVYYDGFRIEHINPLLFKDMIYLKYELDKIRNEYTLEPYPWKEWTNVKNQIDKEGHMLGVGKDQPLRATHFEEVRQCCITTYSDLLKLKPPVDLNTTPTIFRENTGLIPLDDADEKQGYVLQHVIDKNGEPLEINKYFPEWKKIIDLINRN
jgi:hypothetical protein